MRYVEIGNVVHYPMNGRCMPAMVMANVPTVDLIVHTDAGVITRRQVADHEWHWPCYGGLVKAVV